MKRGPTGSITNPSLCLTHRQQSWNFILWVSAVPPFCLEKHMNISIGWSSGFNNRPTSYFILLSSRSGAQFLFTFVWAWLSNLLLTNKIRQTWSCVTLQPKSSTDIVASVLVDLSFGSLVLEEISFHVLRRGPWDQQETRKLDSFQQPCEWARR